jgi:hypothetical protein
LRSCSWSSRASKEKHTWSSIREKFVDERWGQTLLLVFLRIDRCKRIAPVSHRALCRTVIVFVRTGTYFRSSPLIPTSYWSTRPSRKKAGSHSNGRHRRSLTKFSMLIYLSDLYVTVYNHCPEKNEITEPKTQYLRDNNIWETTILVQPSKWCDSDGLHIKLYHDINNDINYTFFILNIILVVILSGICPFRMSVECPTALCRVVKKLHP